MVFTNSIMTTQVNRIINWPPMSSMAIGGYKSVAITYLWRGYQEPSVVTIPIPDHIDGHYVRPNKVALKYPDFKKDVDPDAHVRMFNSKVKANTKTSKEYIINAFNYMLRNTTLY
jgi:hypothetical protein